MSLENLSCQKSFGGWHKRYKHHSEVLDCDMTFAVYLPPQAEQGGKLPVLYWLSGLTCTDENFMQKAGAHRVAAELGMIIVAPDTSPRGPGVPGDPDNAWDFGLGAGFYLNATQEPWSKHYRMHDYVVQELPALVEAHFPACDKRGISGHSMGGHGALVCALRNPGRYQSVSAFSPINNPMDCPWGQKAFSRYLGEERSKWREWDACVLISEARKSCHCWWIRAIATTSWPPNSSPRPCCRLPRRRAIRWSCACNRAMTTATSLSPASSRTTCVIMDVLCSVNVRQK